MSDAKLNEYRVITCDGQRLSFNAFTASGARKAAERAGYKVRIVLFLKVVKGQ